MNDSREIRSRAWAIEKRYEFIEFRLFWAGRLNLSDLMGTFEQSRPQASIDINTYLRIAPANAVYDRRQRTYVRGAEFDPHFLQIDATDLLSQLEAVYRGFLPEAKAWIGTVPEMRLIPVPLRGVRAVTLRAVLHAIRDRECLDILYQSMSRPAPIWRRVEPHALGNDGFRWHMRAFCAIDGGFKDFLLSRVLDLKMGDCAASDPSSDADWHRIITVMIGPHPDLSPAQAAVIGLDYEMECGVARIQVQAALLYYTLKRLGLDIDPKTRPPQDQQIVLLNRDEVLGQLGGCER
jgi:hypothetical protein